MQPLRNKTPRETRTPSRGSAFHERLAAAQEGEERAPEEICVHPPEECYAHAQEKENTHADTIKTGFGLLMFMPGSGAGAGLAGMLPTYSVGGGGGTITGRGAAGTAAARGETTVAPASKWVASKIITICSPNETTSPAFKTRGPCQALSIDKGSVGGAKVFQHIFSALERQTSVTA